MTDLTVTRLCLLVTGSREWDDPWTIKEKLEEVALEAAEHGDAVELIIRHGACYPWPIKGRIPAKSADWLAHLWCQRFGPDQPVPIIEDPMPAQWEAPCRPTCGRPRRDRDGFRPKDHRQIRGGRSICPAAGMYRNTDMILKEPRPDTALAFILDGSTGTSGCVRRLREASIPVDPVERWSPGRRPPNRTEHP